MVGLISGILAAAQGATEVVETTGFDARVFGIFGALLGTGIIVFGAAHGISRIASGATEAIARQPEAGGRIFTSMLLAAALIEGISFFGLIVCFMAILWLK